MVPTLAGNYYGFFEELYHSFSMILSLINKLNYLCNKPHMVIPKDFSAQIDGFQLIEDALLKRDLYFEALEKSI